MDRDLTTPNRWRGWKSVTVAGMAALVLAGCSSELPGDPSIKTGWLPSTPDTTDHTEMIINLWNGTWITAWIVGFLTWGLMIWCMIAYRRRKGETGMPVQIRYHLPLEILYTIVPIMMVGVLFTFTARDMAAATAVDESKTDVEIQVIGKRWAWDFNYDYNDPANAVYETSEQVPLDGTEVPVPTLYLPVDQTVTLKLDSRDVIHSFWVPGFLYKEDMIPGKFDQYYQFTPTKLGTYPGKCAELCGEFHSEMIFQVQVVTQEEYDAYLETLRAKGQTGSLDIDLGRTKENSTQEGQA